MKFKDALVETVSELKEISDKVTDVPVVTAVHYVTDKTYLYHVTKLENLDSIMEHGLIRGGIEKKGSAVYLSEQPDSWYTDYIAADSIILKVDVIGLYGCMVKPNPDIDEILVMEDVEPSRISIYSGVDEQESRKNQLVRTALESIGLNINYYT